VNDLFSKLEQGDVLEGTLERVVYQNADSHWTVGKVKTHGGDVITCVGALLGVVPGTNLALRGAWVEDSKYGRQFKVESYQTRTPETLVGIERYLASGFIPGIGPELARRIVDRFGLEALQVISATPKRLEEVDGLGPSRVSRIMGAWQAQQEIQDVMVFLRGYDIPTGYAVRIFKRYGKEAVTIVKQNPYRLALDIWGIGFRTADAIAQKLGMEKTAPERVESGLLHSLGEATGNGHLHVPEAEAIAAGSTLLQVEEDLVTAAADRLISGGLLVREDLGGAHCLSPTWCFESEEGAATRLADILSTEQSTEESDPEDAILRFTRETGISLADEQKAAVRAAARDKCVVITGGPGVGKTTLVRAITSMFVRDGRRFALSAPTGRAAKRLGESTQLQALTLHRLLEFQPQHGGFDRNAERPLELDSLIVDEASMLDISLFLAVLLALPADAQLILVGDVDQLPSVGPGAVLSDVIGSGCTTVVRLTEIFRQSQESRIITNAHLVNRGEVPQLETPAGVPPADLDFFFIERNAPAPARDTILDLVSRRMPARFGLDPFADIQVLTPMHRGELGTQTLNETLQNTLNPSVGSLLKRGDREFRLGDKVMQIKNNYDRDVFNGDVGVVSSVEKNDGLLRVAMFGGPTVEYKKDDLDQLVHAYAISVHKSQGSEYPAVVLPLMTQHFMMLQRNLLYTAMTRGRRLVVIVGSQRAISLAVSRAESRTRYTYLAERLQRAMRSEIVTNT